MQISRKRLEHNRRHQKKKITGKCRIQQAQIYTRRQEKYSQNQDQNIRCVCRKHIPIQQPAGDCDKDMEDQIDVLQRNFLRRILGIKWPEKISNTELYTKTQVAKWRQVITTRRLRSYGHIQRQDDNTPARQSQKEALRPVNKPQGILTTTWIKLVRNNLIDAGIQHYYSIDLVNVNDTHFPQEINELAQDRDSWRVFTENAMYY